MSLTEPDPWGRYSDESRRPASSGRTRSPPAARAARSTSRWRRPWCCEPSRTSSEWGSDLQGRIVEVCDRKSVAEVSAAVSMPIGVVRVLLGDLVEQGFVGVQATLNDSSSRDERLDLIERTLRGLRAF